MLANPFGLVVAGAALAAAAISELGDEAEETGRKFGFMEDAFRGLADATRAGLGQSSESGGSSFRAPSSGPITGRCRTMGSAG